VRSLTSQPPTLEELFLRHYQADEAAATPAGDGQASREGARR
jgi:ABC-2 type transport system ATP-binding protein